MAKLTAAERAARLVALLGRLEPGARIEIDELARAVDMTEAQLAQGLETLTLCGVAPYEPHQLVPLFVEDGYVEVWGEMPALGGQVRLSQDEARAVAAALQAAGFDADDPLPARLLEAAASEEFDPGDLAHTIRTTGSSPVGETYSVLSSALKTSSTVRISYSTAGTAEFTVRAVEPASMFSERGVWYLTAWCRTAGGWRTFRTDRIASAELTDERFEPDVHGAPPADQAAFDPSGLPCARLRFSADEPYVEREWQGGRIVDENADGSVEVEVPYAGTAWIARQVVARLGGVQAVGPAEVRDAVRRLGEAVLSDRTAG